MIQDRMIVGLAVAALAVGPGVALAQAASAQQAGAPASAKMISVSFATVDLDRSVAFYTNVIGLTQTRVIENPTQKKIRMDFPGSGAGLLLIKDKHGAPAAATPRIGRINMEVPDLRALEARLIAAGYKLQMGITESAEYRVLSAVAIDPDGNELEMIQYLK
jgi:predicted enzyme related to lactoylglutathione lyase